MSSKVIKLSSRCVCLDSCTVHCVLKLFDVNKTVFVIRGFFFHGCM